MKRIYQALWSALIAILIFACDDSNVNIVDNDIDNQFSKILFTPDSLSFPNDTTIAQVTFYGIDFSKIIPDSIIIDNSNVSFERLEDKKIIANLKGISRGTHSIDFFHKSSKVTLDKKLIITYDESAPPSAKSIYFTPDTVYIKIGYEFNKIYLQGTSFKTHKIDSVFVGKEKCQLGSMGVSMLPIYTTTSLTGNYPVFLYYKGNKIELLKKLTIINPIIDFDILSFNNFYRIIHKVPVQMSNYHIERYVEFNHALSFPNCNSYMSGCNFNLGHFSNSIRVILEFDSEYRFIKRLYSYRYERNDLGSAPYSNTKIELELHDIPYSINLYEDNKIELAIELYGTKINEYYPLVSYHYEWWSSQKGYDRTYNFTIPKTDSITGKIINYYPATDSSSIRIYLRNY